MTRTLPAVAILAIGALAVAGCGGSSSSSSGEGGAYGSGGSTQNSKSESSAAGSGGASVVSVADNSKLGKIIVDSKGLTLYDFHKDKGGKSACYGACASTWPPLTTSGAPKAMNGAEASKLGTIKRGNGIVQVTYAGHPLYSFIEDVKPGEAIGNDSSSYGAQWYALKPNGEEAGG